MQELLGSSPNAILGGGKGNIHKHETPLLGAPGEHLENEERPTQSMSKDEGLLAHLGYKQGSLSLLSEMSRTKLTVYQS